MMNHGARKMISILMTLCLAIGMWTTAAAQAPADFEALLPLMDLVCAASEYSANAPESIPGTGEELSVSFIDAFFRIGQKWGAKVGVTNGMLEDTNAQTQLLTSIFAATVPALETVDGTDEEYSFIGFHPVTVNNGTDGSSIQIIGEMYAANKPMREMSGTDYLSVEWLDRAVFTFQSDASAWNGFRLMGYSIGTDLSMEEVLQGYFQEIAVEYESKLGFMLLYPAAFTDEMIAEDDHGVSAEMPDGSAAFFAKCVANENGATLADYVSIAANAIPGSVSVVNEEMQYATVAYVADSYSVFDVYIVTAQHIYQAQLRYLTSLSGEYAMYNAYLENSFVVNELSQG